MKKYLLIFPLVIALSIGGVYFSKDDARFGGETVPETVVTEATSSYEDVAQRTYNTKKYINVDGTITANIMAGDYHYKENGAYVDTDMRLVDMGAYWEMSKHNYHIQIKKVVSDGNLIRYRNVYDGADHALVLDVPELMWVDKKDFSNAVPYIGIQQVTGEKINDYTVRYNNAFGTGLHLEIILENNGFRKELIIDSRNSVTNAPTANHKLVLLFKTIGNFDVKEGNTTWNKTSYMESDGVFELKEGISNENSSYVQPARLEDSAIPPTKTPIKVFWKKYKNAVYQAKVIPLSVLDTAVFPVRADTVTTYSPTVDARMYLRNSNFATGRAASAADSIDTTGATLCTHVSYLSWIPTYDWCIPFLNFDTSALDDGAIVSAASLFVRQTYSDGLSRTMHVVSNTTASDTSIVVGDYDQRGSTSFGTYSASAAGDKTITFNASGIASINPTGYSKYAIRDEKDYNNSAPTDYHGNDALASQENATSAYRPVLSVTYTIGSAAPAITSDFITFE